MIATNQTVFQLATGRKTVATTTTKATTLLICYLSLALSLSLSLSCTPDKPKQIKLCSALSSFVTFRSLVVALSLSNKQPHTHLYTNTNTHTCTYRCVLLSLSLTSYSCLHKRYELHREPLECLSSKNFDSYRISCCSTDFCNKEELMKRIFEKGTAKTIQQKQQLKPIQ